MARKITERLLLFLAIGLVLIFIAQAAVRHFLELPALRQLEYNSDAKAVAQVRSNFAEQLRTLEQSVIDYAAWDDAYDFMGRDRNDPRAALALASEFGTTAHRNTRINGMIFLDPERRIVDATAHDRYTGNPEPEPILDLKTLPMDAFAVRAGSRKPEHARSGLVSTNSSILMFAASEILDSAEQLPSRGTLVFWRFVDAMLVADIAHLSGVQLELIPAASAMQTPALAEKLRFQPITSLGFLPRDDQGNLYWTLFDYTGRPAYLVRQPADPREFDEGLLAFSTMVGFVSSALVLMLLTLFLSRSFVRRVTQATAVMGTIRESGDFTHVLPTVEGDELSEMFSHFNDLLRRIRDQEHDLTTRNEELAEISQRDALTGIHNRRYFDETFDRCWRQAARSGRSISVMLIDVDYFKAFNDNYGHQSGDRVLKQVAMALQDNLHRATDFVARYGGEEFCVILTETNPDDAMRVAESLRKSIIDLGIRHDHSRCEKVVTVSVGIASINADSKVIYLDLLRAADAALYEAKATGRNRVVRGDRDQAIAAGSGHAD